MADFSASLLEHDLENGFHAVVRSPRQTVPWRNPSGQRKRPLFSDFDLGLIRTGNHCQMYTRMGAHPVVREGVAGTRFAVWAPNAEEVSVLCDRNYWTAGQHRLERIEDGMWTGFMPSLYPGAPYKFGIRTRDGAILEKADPFAFAAELRPRTASVVADINRYVWGDEDWLVAREEIDWSRRPISIYEVHLGSWRRPSDGRTFLNYRELAHELVDYVRALGFTHIELLPITEHPFDGSWGYQTTGYFAPTSRFGSPEDFMYFVDVCHQAELGVIVDWVPAHFPIDLHGLARFDGTCLYEHEDPRQGFHPDWGTLVFNFGRDEVRNFLLSSARFWADKYHVDGLRVDAVASMLYLDYSRKDGEWVPNAHGGRENLEAVRFLRDLNVMMHRDFPGLLMLAEESTAWGGVSRPVYCGGLGFGMKWDMGWMNDTLRYLDRDPIHRAHHQNELSFRMVYAFTENFLLPLSHDEVVHGKQSLLSRMPGDYWQKFANLRLLYAYQYAMPGKKLLFMGAELGQWHEWQEDGQLDWALLDHSAHAGVQRFVADLNRVYAANEALFTRDFQSEGFRWIHCDDWQSSTYAFLRLGETADDAILCAFNFTPVPRPGYRLGVPEAGYFAEVLNSDAAQYGGSNFGNLGGRYSQPIPAHGLPHSIAINLPPLGAVMLRRVAGVS